MPQRCASGARELNCGMSSLLVRTGLRITLRPRRGTPAVFDGDLGVYSQFPVSGSVDTDGFLSLTGEGWCGCNSGTRIALAGWWTREADGVMTGSLTTEISDAANPVFSFTWVLAPTVS
jgi:hypothetical protein